MSVIALGTFDGVHIGHRALIAQACAQARQRGETAFIHTFSNHPRAIYAAQPRLLMTDARRLRVLGSLGATVVADSFTQEYAMLSPLEFAKMLCERLNMTLAVTGGNYTFGARGAGDVALLRELGEALGFDVLTAQDVRYKGEIVSSTRVRACVEAGDMQDARAMLNAPYELAGEILHNRHIGSTLGFPTANIAYDAALALPADGVYASRALLAGRAYDSVTNVGSNPTVGGKALTVETHLLDFSGDIYGKYLTVYFARRLRGEVRFESTDALRAQVERDKQNARLALKGDADAIRQQ